MDGAEERIEDQRGEADSSLGIGLAAGQGGRQTTPIDGNDAGLLGAFRIHALVRALGIRPTKKLGQNFMVDPGTVRRIVSLAGVTADSRVLEVGPGLGSLTLGLLETGALVTAVEIDPCLAEQLPKTVAALQPEHAMNFSLVPNDALKVTATDLAAAALDADNPDRPFLLVSNLPYNAAVPILLTLLEKCRGLRSAVVLVQDEVADRLSASPGSKSYGVPSVKLAWYGEAFKAGKVARSVFWPVPNVDSALVAFVRREAPLGDNGLRRRTFRLVDAAFGQRRKTLRAALKGLASVDDIAAVGIDPTLRGEKLAVDDFVRLAKACPADAE